MASEEPEHERVGRRHHVRILLSRLLCLLLLCKLWPIVTRYLLPEPFSVRRRVELGWLLQDPWLRRIGGCMSAKRQRMGGRLGRFRQNSRADVAKRETSRQQIPRNGGSHRSSLWGENDSECNEFDDKAFPPEVYP